MPSFSIRLDTLDGSAVMLTVSGYLDAHTFEQLEEAIAGTFAKGHHRIIIDLEGVTYISSAGAGVFIWALGEAQDAGGNMVLLNPTPAVLEVIKLLGLDQMFTISRDSAAAQAQL